MAHLALYRTYRPQDFDSVVGQKHIVQTVKNQIKNNLLAHAYMLTGPRGTGKTSIARIVAKAINCTNTENGNPCSSCKSCLAVNNGNHPDVLELDGASNNGVDDIRDIRDRVKYLPSLSPYKMYIIDEVHMLSTGAFNALLKTLEEPPPHVIFMLATTEIHKVPDTILSRVQRFDLKQISSTDMSDHLIRILNELEIEFESGVPELVATLAAGGLRDALSMLDQAIAYKTDIIKLADIHDLNGSVGVDDLVDIIESIIDNNFTNIIESSRSLLSAGKLPVRIIDGLLEMLRDVLKAKKIGTEDLTGLAGKLSSQQVISFIKKLNTLTHELKIATNSELILEIGLIELGFIEVDETKKQKEERVENTPPTTNIPATNYSVEIQELMKQVRDLKTEINELRNIKMTEKPNLIANVESSAPINDSLFITQTLSPEIPVFVQGELVNSEPFDTLENDPLTNKLNTPITAQETNTFNQNTVSNDLLIEDILTNATKQDKSELQNKITTANSFAKLDIKEVVMLLKDAQIVAASPKGCILVYDYETTTQKLLTVENRNKAYQILSDMMERSYGFLALPKDFWLETRTKYVTQTKQGNTPELEQYPQSVEVKSDVTTQTEKAPFYQEVVDMFGDMVEVND